MLFCASRAVTGHAENRGGLLDNPSNDGELLKGLFSLSGTGRAFNSLCRFVFCMVTKGRYTNTSRNYVPGKSREGKSWCGGLGAENEMRASRQQAAGRKINTRPVIERKHEEFKGRATGGGRVSPV